MVLPRHVPVRVEEGLLKLMLQIAKNAYPRECILLLRGERRRDGVYLEEVLVPPMPVVGDAFASFNPYMLPVDFTIVGSFHSHPSGGLSPSVEDLNNFYGSVMLIAAYPYRLEGDVAAFNSRGERLQLHVVKRA